MASTVCLVCLISTVNGRSKKSLKCGITSGHTTKLEQSISLDIYGLNAVEKLWALLTAETTLGIYLPQFGSPAWCL